MICHGGGYMATNIETGKYGEDLVADLLTKAGWTIIVRNWRCSDGELDLVAHDDGAVVAVEVKTRRGTNFGSPVEAVTRAKAARLRRLLMRWIRESDVHAREVRIDVVGVLIGPTGQPVIQHIRNAC